MSRRKPNAGPPLSILLSCLAAALISAAASQAQSSDTARVIRVATDGVDRQGCGTAVAPCRSLSQGIANANEGDTVLVGPGRYGDLNGNHIFGEAGEEFGSGPCFCLIDVNKRLTLKSEKGALQTVLDGAGTVRRMVAITASFVTFGLRSRGFTVTGSTRAGLAITADEGVVVKGNLATANRVGNDFGEGFTVIRGHNHRLIGNVATDNGGGFSIFGDNVIISDNVAASNAGGGFGASGSNDVLRRNVSTGNSAGFGFDGPGHRLLLNSAIGNRFFGVVIQHPQPENPATADFVARFNNIYGNGTGITSPEPCGFRNQSGIKVIATDNYWGSRQGPGSDDPADPVCDLDGETVTAPFSPVEFEVLVTPRLTGPSACFLGTPATC